MSMQKVDKAAPSMTAAAPARSLDKLVSSFEQGASPEDELERVLTAIDAHDSNFNSFVLVDRQGAARAAAQSAQRWRQQAPLSPIDGVPISVKDMLAVAGLPSRCGSLVSSNSPSRESAPVVRRLVNAGAVIVGLTTTAEFGGASATISPLTGTTRNARDPSRTAGGSSGGAAVSVAAGFCAAAIATDTGGSIRVPAAFNGVVGLKPTGGRIPTNAASALHTLGCPGPIANNVADCARLLRVMTQGRFGDDDPSHPEVPPSPQVSLHEVRIAASRRLGYAPWLDPQIGASFDNLLRVLREHGCQVTEIEPDIDDPLAIFQTHVRANYASILGHLDDAQVAKLSVQVREARAAGLGLSASDFLAAQSAREAFSLALRQSLRFDILITPMTAVPPFAVECFGPAHPELRDSPRGWNPFGYPFNLSRRPALTIPCGTTFDGMPIGCQLVADPWEEPLLLAVGQQIEALLAQPPYTGTKIP